MSGSRDQSRFAQFAFKPRDACVPDDESSNTSMSMEGKGGELDVFQRILGMDSSLGENLAQLKKKAKAEGTLSNYGSLQSKFEAFCAEKGYSFEKFTEQAVLHFILQLDKDGASVAIVCQIKPALSLLEKLAGKEKSAFTATVDAYLEAAKRKAVETKQPVQKAGEVPKDTVEQMIKKYVEPFWEKKKKVDLDAVRTILRVTIVKFTFCRFDCYRQLKACDLIDTEDGIKVNFPRAKNDQWHKGNSSFVVDPLAVRLIKFSFECLGYTMGGTDKSFLNCVLVKKKRGHKVCGTRAISYTHATKRLRFMLQEMGLPTEKVTDKSFKMLGVTSMLEGGATLEEVMHQGRWRTPTMPLQYKVNSDDFKRLIASHVK